MTPNFTFPPSVFPVIQQFKVSDIDYSIIGSFTLNCFISGNTGGGNITFNVMSHNIQINIPLKYHYNLPQLFVYVYYLFLQYVAKFQGCEYLSYLCQDSLNIDN